MGWHIGYLSSLKGHTNKLVFGFALLLLCTVEGEVNVVYFLSGLFRMGKRC